MTEKFVELLTCKLEVAKKNLAELDCEVESKETRPPGNKQGQGQKRVVNIKQGQNTVTIYWCFEDYVNKDCS